MHLPRHHSGPSYQSEVPACIWWRESEAIFGTLSSPSRASVSSSIRSARASHSRTFFARLLAEIWSVRPAWVAGLGSKGGIAPGKDADFVVWDPGATVVVGQEGPDGWTVEHKHKLTPYAGMALKGKIHATYLRGRKIYERAEDGAHEHAPDGPHGRPLLRK